MYSSEYSEGDANIPVVIRVVLDKNGKQITNTELVRSLTIRRLYYICKAFLLFT
jgi:hypothetical protein